MAFWGCLRARRTRLNFKTILRKRMHVEMSKVCWLIYAIFHYFVLSLRKNYKLRIFAFVVLQRNNDKTMRNNEINKSLISAAKYFATLFIKFYRLLAPQFIVFSPRNNDKLRLFDQKDEITKRRSLSIVNNRGPCALRASPGAIFTWGINCLTLWRSWPYNSI